MAVSTILKSVRCKAVYFLILFSLYCIQVNAQHVPAIHRCGAEMYNKAMEAKFPGYIESLQAAFNNAVNSPSPRSGEVYRIPVVFHVIYNTDKQNIPDSCIYNQIKVLNDAYRNRHADTANTRAIFKPLAGDAEIEFFLADTDPDGNPTSGITRTHTDIETFGDITIIIGGFNLDYFEQMKFTDKGGHDAWPTNKYLNIWVADAGFNFLGIYLPALLGLATPPRYPSLPDNWPEGSVDGIVDGVFLQYQTIGNNNPYKDDLQGLVSAGRTAVHEIGHYFGLRHINGDEDCGDDGIDDTPEMVLSTQEAGSCPGADINTCNSDQPDDLPDMWENYMDYSNDICQTLFTAGQVNHMRKVLTTQRDTLYNWPLKTEKVLQRHLSLYPNPAQNEFRLIDMEPGGALSVRDAFGLEVIKIDKLKDNTVSIRDLPSGFYVITYRLKKQYFSGKLIVSR